MQLIPSGGGVKYSGAPALLAAPHPQLSTSASPRQAKHMLRGKDLPRDEAYASKYRAATKAVRQWFSNYVKFEGAGAAPVAQAGC